jgi:hypothetical protein
LYIIREDNISKVVGHFGVGKTSANSQRYVYWPKMREDVESYIRGCILYCTNKPINKNKGVYHILHVPTHPGKEFSWFLWEVYKPCIRDMTIYLW